jgi:hypothetical protein
VLPKLLKFVLRTRFSRPFLILFAIMVTYSLIISTTIPPSGVNTILGYYAAGIIAMFLAMALATGGVMVMKSDRDYLFTLPLSPRDLSLSIFFAQFIAFGTTVLFMFVYLAEAFTSLLLVVDMVALALTFTSLGVIAPLIRTRIRIILSVALALWTLLSFASFPFTPGSAFNGNLYGGTATLLALTAVTVTFAFRSLRRIELDMMKSLVRTTSTDIKSPNSYVGKSPLGAIYSMNLTNISLAGRMNMAGTSRYVSRRVKTRWVALASTAAAVAFFIFALSMGPANMTNDMPNGDAANVILAIGLSFIGFFFSQSAITNERLWLSLTSLPAATYFKHLISSKVISLLVVLSPFAVVDAVLLVLGDPEALGALMMILLVIPGAFVLEICWSAYIAPIQVKGDDMMMPAQFNLRQMAVALPMGGVVIVATVGVLFAPFAAVAGVVLCVLSAALTLSGGFWGRVITRLTENGFV